MIRAFAAAVQKSGLLAKFGFISLVAITLIGLFLGRTLQSSVKQQVLAGAIAEAEMVSRLGLQNEIGPSELRNGMSSERVRSVELAVRSDFARIDVAEVVLWDLNNSIVFASDTSTIGTTTMTSQDLLTAARQTPQAVIVDVSGEDTVGPNARLLRRHGTVVQVYQPLRFGSIDSDTTAGVLRTSVPYGPIADRIAASTRVLYFALAGSLLALYAVLFRVVANAGAELRRRADENERLARHDSLTGLPNRMLFTEEVTRRLEGSNPSPLAIAVIDLDRFKEINDTLGHHHGDLILAEAGRRLQKASGKADMVARLGGDEFALVLPNTGEPATAVRIATRVVSSLAAPIEVEGLKLDIGASVGLAVSPQHGTDLMTLLQRADVAMYEAKRKGTECEVYDPETDDNTRERLALAGELRDSLDSQLVAYYQPKIELETGRVCGVEALVRWNHPTRGLLTPDVFLPLAERNGLMNEVTRVMLAQSLAQLHRWLTAGHDLRLAVNISAGGLNDGALAETVAKELACHPPSPNRLILEITETMIAADPERARNVLRQLRDSGVRCSIDDFGTGYSSLAILRSLPVQELKIDRELVGDLGHRDGSAIVEYCIALGHMLDLQVVAEGVESTEDRERLRALGCDVAQGYLFAKPMPATEFLVWLKHWQSERATEAHEHSPTDVAPPLEAEVVAQTFASWRGSLIEQ